MLSGRLTPLNWQYDQLNLNNLLVTGLYTVQSGSTNSPFTEYYFMVFVLAKSPADNILQIAFRGSTVRMRTLYSGTWSAWATIATA